MKAQYLIYLPQTQLLYKIDTHPADSIGFTKIIPNKETKINTVNLPDVSKELHVP